MESKPTGGFNVKAFLGSAGVKKKVVEYRRAEVIFTQGDACESIGYIQTGWSETLGALEGRS